MYNLGAGATLQQFVPALQDASYLCQHSSTGAHMLYSTYVTVWAQHKQLALTKGGG